MSRLAAALAWAIQPHLGKLADHAVAVAWALMIVVPALLAWFVAGFF